MKKKRGDAGKRKTSPALEARSPQPARRKKTWMDSTLGLRMGQYAYMVPHGFTAMFHLAALHLDELNISVYEWQALMFRQMFQELPFYTLPPIKEVAKYARISYAKFRRILEALSTVQRNKVGSIVRPAYIAPVVKDGVLHYDFAGLYRAYKRFLSAEEQARYVPAMAALAGTRRRQERAHLAPLDASQQEEDTASSPSIDGEHQDAPALSAACVDLLKEILAQYHGDNLPGLVDYTSTQLAGLDGSAQLCVLE
jgi:hypothetical protein